MGWMQHSCRQAAEWMSLQRDEPLGFWRSLTLRMHLRACGDCRQVKRQLGQLGDMSAGLWGRAQDGAGDGDAQR